MKKLILLIFIVTSCSAPQEKKTSIEKIDIYDNLSFGETASSRSKKI